MKNAYYEKTLISLITIALIVSLFMMPDMWYIYISLMLITVFLWEKSKNDRNYNLPFIYIGILDSFSSWFISELFAILIICSVFGLYLLHFKKLNSKKEIIYFLLISCLICICGMVCKSMSHTFSSFITVMGLLLVFSILSIIYEFKLIAAFSGEKNEICNKR